MLNLYATIVGGAVVVLAIVIGVIWFCKLQCKSFSNNNSETDSSDPSAIAELNRGGSSLAEAPPSRPQGAKRFTLEELEQATNQFSRSNLIGHGSFGAVYKGLHRDGSVLAIKRRSGASQQEFAAEVTYLSEIRHRNLVTLLGYCQERSTQMLIFDHLPNGSMCNHLYDTGVDTATKLEFKQRLSIALGAARGLCHLHGLKPPLAHGNFKMANVLVDENFVAKVADAGISKLVKSIEEAHLSCASGTNILQDPEVKASGSFSEERDVYNFGVFLLELVTGKEMSRIDSEGLAQWVETQVGLDNFVDCRLGGSFTMEAMKDLLGLIHLCITFQGKGRPKMEMVIIELERILEKEMAMTADMGEGTTTVTLGSELFSAD